MSSPRGINHPPRRVPQFRNEDYRPPSDDSYRHGPPDSYRPDTHHLSDRVLHGRVSRSRQRRRSLTPMPRHRHEEYREREALNSDRMRWEDTELRGSNNGNGSGGWHNNVGVTIRQLRQQNLDLQDETARNQRDIRRLQSCLANVNSHLRMQSYWITQMFETFRAPPYTFIPLSPHRFSPPPFSAESTPRPPPGQQPGSGPSDLPPASHT